jgi:adenosine deaminase
MSLSAWKGLDPEEFIQRIPKTETHLHIEGALPWHLLQQIDAVKYAQWPDCWKPDYRFDTFQHFESMLIGWACAWYTTPERYHEAAVEIFADIQRCNGRYVEVSFHAGLVEFVPALKTEDVVAAIKSAAPKGMEVRVFAGMGRHNMNPATADYLLRLPEIPLLDGVDVHGVEVIPLQSWMAELWQTARSRGKETKAHAGEYGDAGYVREALDFLGVKRIQHGIAAAQDKELVQRLVRENIVLDVCPISNVKLGRVASIAEHPLRQLLQAGVCCTVSTDDPMMFGNHLDTEYLALAEQGGYSPSELIQIARNGWQTGKASAALRLQALTELEQLAAEIH